MKKSPNETMEIYEIEVSTPSKTRHIRIQPIPGVKIEDLRQIVTDLPHHDLTKVILDAGTNMLLPIHLKAYSKT